MFSKGGPKPWNTRRGQSKLDGLIEEVREKKLRIKEGGVPETEKGEEGVPAAGKEIV